MVIDLLPHGHKLQRDQTLPGLVYDGIYSRLHTDKVRSTLAYYLGWWKVNHNYRHSGEIAFDSIHSKTWSPNSNKS